MSRDWKSLSTRMVGTFACLAVGVAWVQYCINHGHRFIQPDTIFSIYCEVIGRSSPEVSCPNAELMVLFPLLIIIAILYYVIVAFIAIIPIGAAVSGILFIWLLRRNKNAQPPRIGETISQVATDELKPAESTQVGKKYHNLKVINSLRQARTVGVNLVVQEDDTAAHLANDAEKVSVKSAVKEIFSRADRNA